MILLCRINWLVICVMLVSCSATGFDNGTPGDINTGDGVAALNWSAPTENIDSSTLDDLAGYRIYYSEQPDNLISSIDVEDGSITSYVIENLNTSTTYYFVVTAVNNQNIESTFSNVAVKVIY